MSTSASGLASLKFCMVRSAQHPL